MKNILIILLLFAFKLSAQPYVMKLAGDTLQILDVETGNLTNINNNPATFNRVVLQSDVVNNNVTANTLADVTGLSFAVESGKKYWFKFFVTYTSQATTTGSRWVINGPAISFLTYSSYYTLSATSMTFANAAAYNIPAACNASSLASGNVAVIEGVIQPSANGTVQLRFASEITASAITAKSQFSFLTYRLL